MMRAARRHGCSRSVEDPAHFMKSQQVTIERQRPLEVFHIEDDVTEIVDVHVVAPRYPIGISAPLIWLASSDTRKIKVCAMDSGLTHFDGSASGMLLRFAGVSMVVGSTPLTVTPAPASTYFSFVTVAPANFQAGSSTRVTLASHARRCTVGVPIGPARSSIPAGAPAPPTRVSRLVVTCRCGR